MRPSLFLAALSLFFLSIFTGCGSFDQDKEDSAKESFSFDGNNLNGNWRLGGLSWGEEGKLVGAHIAALSIRNANADGGEFQLARPGDKNCVEWTAFTIEDNVFQTEVEGKNGCNFQMRFNSQVRQPENESQFVRVEDSFYVSMVKLKESEFTNLVDSVPVKTTDNLPTAMRAGYSEKISKEEADALKKDWVEFFLAQKLSFAAPAQQPNSSAGGVSCTSRSSENETRDFAIFFKGVDDRGLRWEQRQDLDGNEVAVKSEIRSDLVTIGNYRNAVEFYHGDKFISCSRPFAAGPVTPELVEQAAGISAAPRS